MRQVGSEFVVRIAALFTRLGPQGQEIYLIVQLSVFLLLLYLTLHSFFEREKKLTEKGRFHGVLSSDILFASCLFSFIIISRFPLATYGYQNPDEGVWIACAKALVQNPRPWLSADTSTSGPLVLLPLFLLKLMLLPIDFGSIKLAAGIMMALTVVFTFLTYSNLVGKSVARIAILFSTIALSLTTYWDFITYNGEHVPLFFFSVSLFLLSRILSVPNPKFSNFIISGLLLGMLPFAKLQSVPIGLFIAVVALAILVKKKYRPISIFYFILSGFIPTVVIVAWIIASGDLNHFWTSYILFNLNYSGSETPVSISLFDKIKFAWRMLFDASDLTLYFILSFTISLFCVVFIDLRQFIRAKKNLLLVSFAAISFFISLFCIGQPYRSFTHYVYFAYFTSNFLMLSLIGTFFETNSVLNDKVGYWKTATFCSLAFISAIFFFQRFTFQPNYNVYAELRKGSYASRPEVVKKINQLSEPGDGIAIWGWDNTFYGDTDLIMATRNTDTSGLLITNPFQLYLLNTYLLDIQRNRPTIFLDAISPNATKFFDRSQFGFENFESVKLFIDTNYKMAAEIEGYRIYVLNDKLVR